MLDSTLTALLRRPLALRAGLIHTSTFNLGDQDDFRVPDQGLHVSPPIAVWTSTAALVVEVVSPGDESWEKLPFYAARDVGEVVIADPHARTLAWLARSGDGYVPTSRSRLLGIDVADVVAELDWPPVDADQIADPSDGARRPALVGPGAMSDVGLTESCTSGARGRRASARRPCAGRW